MPPKPLQPAPPESEWGKYLETTAAKYKLSSGQRELADAVLSSCQARAKVHREQRKADYDAAQKIPDPAKKAETLKALNERLDGLYDELTQRVDSLATLEQNKPPAPPATPGPPPAKPAGPGGTTPPAPTTPAAQPPPAPPANGPAPADAGPKKEPPK